MLNHFYRAVFTGLLALAAATPAPAQNYPSRSIRIIVPYAAGGGADIAMRVIAAKLQENTGQPVVIENRPGASEIPGTEALARAAPDGYTMGFLSNTHAINQTLQPKLPYDSERDIQPVMKLVNVPLVMIIPPSLPVKNVKELVALAKAQPGKLNYASFGTGGPHGLAMEWFKNVSGTDIVAINYMGIAPGLTALAQGDVHVMFTGMTGGAPWIKSGKARAIAVTSAAGMAAMPDVPPIARDYPEFDMSSWYGLGLPGGTPPEVVARVHEEISKVLNDPQVRQKFDSMGVEAATPMPQKEFIALMRKETLTWSRVIKAAGIKLN